MSTKIDNIHPLNSFSYAEFADGPTVRYPPGVTSTGFRSQLESFRVLIHSEELWNSFSMDNNFYSQ